MNKLLVFSANWCKPCQMMKGIIDQLDSSNLVKYDYDSNKDMVDKYRVPGVPCFILVNEHDEELDIVLGVTSKEVLEELLSR